MFKSGRVIVPAEGWYEWTGEKGHKQPWYIRLKSGESMLMAAITDFRPGSEMHEGSGWAVSNSRYCSRDNWRSIRKFQT
ncbi:SOS response associated peptidase (SRAP) [Collimonas sp. OK607]|uniref:SOS response-associated peptidase family protein n=1 Tax=Collimonas sp. OK607 TaxID=1798194 RepID=UPI0008EE5003|nr:SOS response-associated peptidase family protein [Collimonas sp. OK607]SFA84911.1 SOS response associated peptidase (SRAP) [Collimonas sp. OK607]